LVEASPPEIAIQRHLTIVGPRLPLASESSLSWMPGLGNLPDKSGTNACRRGVHRPAQSGARVRRCDRHQDRTRSRFLSGRDYHQDFLTLNPNYPYIVVNDLPKIGNLKRLFGRALRATGEGPAQPPGRHAFSRQGQARQDPLRPVNAAAQRTIEAYLALAGHRSDLDGALFRPVKNNRTGRLDRHLDPASVYWNIVRKYGLETGISAEVNGLCLHLLRATAATNALSHDSDIAKVQEWLGHANVSTTRLYDRRKNKPEDSPTFRVKY
jgi:integrase